MAAESLGIDITRYKTIAYGVSAMYAGAAGGLFAGMLGIVTPESFDLFQVIVHFCMVIVGGLGSIWGGVLGAVGLVYLQEVLRAFRHLQEIAFGGLILFTVLVVPGARSRSSSATCRDGRSRFAARSTTSEGRAPLSFLGAVTPAPPPGGNRPVSKLRASDISISFGGLKAPRRGGDRGRRGGDPRHHRPPTGQEKPPSSTSSAASTRPTRAPCGSTASPSRAQDEPDCGPRHRPHLPDHESSSRG